MNLKDHEAEEGKMYQMIEGTLTEVVRWGDELIPANDSRAHQIIGQQVLNLMEEA